MVRDNRHDNAYIFGAICPDRATGAAIITPTANTECMNHHLAAISTRVAPEAIANPLALENGRRSMSRAAGIRGSVLYQTTNVLTHASPWIPCLAEI